MRSRRAESGQRSYESRENANADSTISTHIEFVTYPSTPRTE